MKRIDLTGMVFGKLTAIEPVKKVKNGDMLWRCKCDCGNESLVQSGNLKSGHTKSCGCYRVDWCKENCTKHGLEHSRLYKIWFNMNLRCLDETNTNYHRYGGRCISVCDEWKENLQAFVDWAMANGYRDDLTLDRIDNDGNYEPSNCRWVSMREQANNRRSNVAITFNGKTKTMKQWANDVGIPYKVVWQRIQKLGWSAERALTEPVKGRWKK